MARQRRIHVVFVFQFLGADVDHGERARQQRRGGGRDLRLDGIDAGRAGRAVTEAVFARRHQGGQQFVGGGAFGQPRAPVSQAGRIGLAAQEAPVQAAHDGGVVLPG